MTVRSNSFYIDLYYMLRTKTYFTFETTGPPYDAQITIIDGEFGSGTDTAFSVSIYDGKMEYSPSLVKACSDVVKIVSDPPLEGFPVESKAVEGVALFNTMLISDPRNIKLQILVNNQALTSKNVRVGDNVKLALSVDKYLISPGDSFYGNISIYDMFDNFLNMSTGNAFLNITYNGNQFMKINSKVVNGFCMFSPSSIPKIYTSRVYIQAGFYSQFNQLFLSETFEMQVYNLSPYPTPKPTISPMMSKKAEHSSGGNNPTNPSKPLNSVQIPAIKSNNQRINNANSVNIGSVILLVFFLFLISMY